MAQHVGHSVSQQQHCVELVKEKQEIGLGGFYSAWDCKRDMET